MTRTALGRILRVVVQLAVIAPSLALFLATPAAASTTSEYCDFETNPAKYWCFSMVFNAYSGSTDVLERRDRGSTGQGGAVKWQRYITSDWQYAGGTWYLINSYPSGAWRTDYYFASDNEMTAVNIARVVTVQIRNRYQSYTPTDGYYYWCSRGYDFELDITGVLVTSWGGFTC